MTEKRSCAVCSAEINEADMGYLVVVEFPGPLQVCGKCMVAAKTYDGNFGIRCIRREDLARLILRRRPDREKPQRRALAPRTDGKFLYFTLLRPPAPGAIPKAGLVKVESFDRRTFVPCIGRDAYGSALYDRELSADEIWEYEMQAPEYADAAEEEQG